jgi:thymidylate kinase
MKKVIILEGPDGGGKTTLASWLHNTHGYVIVKTGPPGPGDVNAAYTAVLNAAIGRPDKTVFDRLHLGEAIYGPLLRGVDRMGADGLALIEQIIADNNVQLIICCPPWNVLVDGWRAKDDLLKNESQLRTVYNRYVEEAKRLKLAVYDWTVLDAEERLPHDV